MLWQIFLKMYLHIVYQSGHFSIGADDFPFSPHVQIWIPSSADIDMGTSINHMDSFLNIFDTLHICGPFYFLYKAS